MFNINKYDRSSGGAAVVELVWDLGHGPVSDEQTFDSEELADAYINSCKRDYILFKVEKFVKHKKIISLNSKLSAYSNMAFLAGMDRFQAFYSWSKDSSLVSICDALLRMETHFANILPVPTNPSYYNARTDMVDILAFCQGEVNSANKKEAVESA